MVIMSLVFTCMFSKVFFATSLIVVFLLPVQLVFAQAPSPGAGVVISLSEVSGCESNEWIELYNNSDQDIDLKSWKIEKTVPANVSKTLDATISAKTYKKVWTGSSFLTNEGFTLQLKDAQGDVLETNAFEKCPDNSSASWIKQGTSWLLTTTKTEDRANEYTAISTPTAAPTPTAKPTTTPSSTSNSTPSPTAAATATPGTQPTTVILSEIYACQADGTKEWVELQNTGAASVTLTNWKLTDDDNNDQPIPALTIAAKGYSVVEITKYGRGMFTNDGDIVNLLDATGKKVDSYEYTACHSDQSFAKVGSSWKETVTMTRGQSNGSDTATPTPEPTPVDSSDDQQVLGATTEESEATPEPAQAEKSGGNSETLIAVGSIGLGLLVLAGIGGYFGWDWWKKRKLTLAKVKIV